MDPDSPTLARRAGFVPRGGASPATIRELEDALWVVLPGEFRELWSYSDGMIGDGIELIRLAVAAGYAGIFPPAFGYFPFADANDSNPYAVCCRGPLTGHVVHLSHDGEARLVCRGLARFLELVAAARDGGEVDQLEGDFAFDRPERDPAARATATELIRVAGAMAPDEDVDDNGGRTDALRFAAQLFGPGQEDELAGAMAMGDEYVREAVLERWRGLGSPASLRLLGEDAAEFRRFVAELRRAFEAAGVATTSDGPDGFRLQPGDVGINFFMLYADRRRPESVAEWVRRLKACVEGRG